MRALLEKCAKRIEIKREGGSQPRRAHTTQPDDEADVVDMAVDSVSRDNLRLALNAAHEEKDAARQEELAASAVLRWIPHTRTSLGAPRATNASFAPAAAPGKGGSRPEPYAAA